MNDKGNLRWRFPVNSEVGRTDGDCLPPCYVIIIRLLHKVNPSERILDVTLLELSDEVIESE